MSNEKNHSLLQPLSLKYRLVWPDNPLIYSTGSPTDKSNMSNAYLELGGGLHPLDPMGRPYRYPDPLDNYFTFEVENQLWRLFAVRNRTINVGKNSRGDATLSICQR
jgi:hypothetical protein